MFRLVFFPSPWLNADDTRFDFWRRPEIVLANLHQMIDSCQELSVNRKPTIQFVTRLRH